MTTEQVIDAARASQDALLKDVTAQQALAAAANDNAATQTITASNSNAGGPKQAIMANSAILVADHLTRAAMHSANAAHFEAMAAAYLGGHGQEVQAAALAQQNQRG